MAKRHRKGSKKHGKKALKRIGMRKSEGRKSRRGRRRK
jgi:hypothetical protein